MNKFLWLAFFRLMDPADGLSGGGGGEAPPVSADPVPSADPTPVSTDPAPAVDPTPTDPNDPMSALEAAMAAELSEDPAPVDPAAPVDPVAVPDAFRQALSISEFVKGPEHVEQAVRAADEVWRVATGQIPARTMLEGFKETNPQQYQAILQDLTGYIEQVTGKSFGAAPETPPDPRDARLSAIEQRFQQEEQQRQTAQFNQQITRAREVGMNFLTEKAKGTFVEGQEQYIWNQIGAKADVTPEQMTQMLLTGKTEKLEAAFKAVQKDEATRLKAYNANLIKKHRTLGGAVPAVKGAPQGNRNASSEYDAYLPGETSVQYATRQFNKGK